jgi:predicted hotdog family 3-hydroxylacyl-ACP dehydratase
VRAGKPVQIGLLLGSRAYKSEVGWFKPGWTLGVRVTQLLKAADGVSAFACELSHGERLLARAEIKAYQPDDIEPYLSDLAEEL